MRLGGLVVSGAALLAIGAVLFLWQSAPALLRSTPFEFLFVGGGLLALLLGFVTTAIDQWTARPRPLVPSRSEPSSPESSLMALPALISRVAETSVSPPSPPGPAARAPPLPAPAAPPVTGITATDPGSSTLLIPFGEPPASPPPAAEVAPRPQVVSRLIHRMNALQRALPAEPPVPAPSLPSTNSMPFASTLRLRLSRVPTPPDASSSSGVRRCSDCGDELGSPPQFEPCADCGRALCERCYWRATSGPAQLLCATCIQDRTAPRPPSPSITFGGPVPTASALVPSERRLQPRRPVS